jgi:RNA polymerase sigma factor (sigma-70 family)
MHLLTIDDQPQSGDLDPRHPGDFAALVERHHRDLLVYAVALTRNDATARDIVQESFIIAYEKIALFDVTRDFATWMRGIVRNKWREWLRKNKRYDLSENELARIDADIAAWQTIRQLEENTMFEALEQCIEKLPGNLVEAVRSYYFESLSGDEVSAKLNISPAAARKRLERARILLRQCLDRQIDENQNHFEA